MRTRITATLIVATLLGITMIGLRHIRQLDNKIELKKIELKDNGLRLQLLDKKYDNLNLELNQSGADKAKVEHQLQELQKERDELQVQLQAKIKAKQADVAYKAQQAATASVRGSQAYAASGCGDNEYASYIYMHESHCRTDAINSIGCKGIGQRCGVLPCTLQDYNCQNKWFSNYAIARYGSWANAYKFWLSHHWW